MGDVPYRSPDCRACPPAGAARPTAEALVEAELRRLADRHPEDLATPATRDARLSTCATCERCAEDGTCLLCGCYVRIRAALRRGRCPWPKVPRWT